MLRSFLLLHLGKDRTTTLSDIACAHIELDGDLVAFVSGKNSWTWKTTADTFYSQQRTQVDALGRTPLLVMQETDGTPPWNESHELPLDFTEAVGESDDITRSPRGKYLRCTATNSLYEALCNAETFEAACDDICIRVDEVIA
jgi:hypothetical protein